MYLVFYNGVMKSSVRKAVHGKYISILLFKPFFKFQKIFFLDQFSASLIRQAQSDSHWAMRCDTFFYKRKIIFNRSKMILPTFALVNICTISQMPCYSKHTFTLFFYFAGLLIFLQLL